MRALLIEDDAMIGQGLVRALGDAGWTIDWTRTGGDGEEALRTGGHAIALLDLGLPEKTGLEVLAAMRRRVDHAVSTLSSGEVELDLASHAVTYRGMTHALPAREFALMQVLVEHQGSIISKAALEERLYGWGEEVQSNAVEALIHYVRRRFDKDIIRNVRGAGWTVPKTPQ